MPNVVDYPTVTLAHTMSYLAFITIGFRLTLRWYRREKFVLEDYLMMSSVIWLFMRLGLIHMVLVWGTNNVSDKIRAKGFSQHEIWQRSEASKMLLANRFAYNTFLWNMKCCLLLFYKRLTINVERYTLAHKFMWVIMGLSYIAVQVSTFVECKPFHLYWQVVPSAGGCEKAQIQLFLLGGLNIFTDLLLILFPLPALYKTRMPRVKKLQILLLFLVGFFVVAVTIVRLPQNSKNKSLQKNRTTWASVELFAACFVANAPTVYILLRRYQDPPTAVSAPKGDSGYGSQQRKKFWLRGTKTEGSITDTYQMAKYGLKAPKSTSDEMLTTNVTSATLDEEARPASWVVKAETATVVQEHHTDGSVGSVDLGLKQRTETKIWSADH